MTVVWVGYDDNSATNLSGARAALPIWSRFTAAVRPARGYPAFVPPAGIITATVDPQTGQLATDLCPYRMTEVFPEWQAPMEFCRQHSPYYTGEMWADMSLGETLIDPLTGEPINPSITEEPVLRTTLTDDGLEIVQIGHEGSPDSSIVIRPSQPREEAPAGATETVTVVPAGQPIGATAPILPPPPPPAPPPPAEETVPPP